MSSGLKSFMNDVLRKAFPFCAVFNIIWRLEIQYSYWKEKLFQTKRVMKMFLKGLICNRCRDLAEMFHAVIEHLNIVISKAVEWCTESTNLLAIA